MEGLGSHCDVIQELHSYRMISEALGTQLAEITEFYPTGFLQARVRQSQEEESERERECERAREGVLCVYTGGQAPPTLTVPAS